MVVGTSDQGGEGGFSPLWPLSHWTCANSLAGKQEGGMVARIKSGSHRGEGSQGPGRGVAATPQRNAPGRSVSPKAGGGANGDVTWEGLKWRSLLKQPTENKASPPPPGRAWKVEEQSPQPPEALREAPGNPPVKACCFCLQTQPCQEELLRKRWLEGCWLVLGVRVKDSLVSGSSWSRGATAAASLRVWDAPSLRTTGHLWEGP